MRIGGSVLLALAITASVLGCTTGARSGAPDQQAPPKRTASLPAVEASGAVPSLPAVEASGAVSALVPLDSEGKGELPAVSVVPSETFGFSAGSPDDLANQRYGNRVDVGVFDSVHGVQAMVVIPMWYGETTTYELLAPSGEGTITRPKSLVDAASKKDGVVWWRGPNASIAYHLEDGFFVLDGMKAKAPH